ncbi:MAG: threonine/serine exporter family protein [Clostridia bacterium]|nr:threonine/serine exporter family protein [Clostridia bacterium]
MDFKQALIIIISGMIGTLGFSYVFQSPKRRTLINILGGLLVCTIYVVCIQLTEMNFFIYFFPALFATVYAEIMARVVKAPATPILACSIISLVPGGKLYYTTYYFVMGEDALFDATMQELLDIALGLAVGIICVTIIVHEINRHKFKQIIDVE